MASHITRKKSSYSSAQETQCKETDDHYDYELLSLILLLFQLLSAITYWTLC
jgi:hypothetical protein